MLKCEQNTVSMSRHVRGAAAAAKLGWIGELQTDFEHGQWWVTNRRTGEQWAVNDCECPSGFDFEKVTGATE